MMEGVSHEAASFAGHQRLDNLCWIYDNNHISIDGRVEITYTDDVAARFLGYGWNVTRVGDANDTGLVDRALATFRQTEDRPTLIIVDSHIGYGSPKADTAAVHGDPLGEEAVRETKRAYGWPEDAQFLVPDGVREHFAEGIGARGRDERERWERLLDSYRSEHPELESADRPDAAPRAARRLGRRHPELRARREGDGDPQGVERRPEGDRRPAALVRERLGRPHRLDRGRPRRVLRGRVRTREPGRPPVPLRDPRARVGGDLQRPLAVEDPPVLVDLPRLLGLRPPGDPPLGADGAAGDPHLHPRLDRPRRGRPDPPAGRAPARAARDPGPERDPSRGRQRGRRGLAADDRAGPPAGGAGAHPPGRADHRPLALRLGRGAAPRRLRDRRSRWLATRR